MPGYLLGLVAAEGGSSFNLTEIMQSAITSVQGDVLGVLTIAVPAIVVVVGAVTGVKFGIKWLKSLGKA